MGGGNIPVEYTGPPLDPGPHGPAIRIYYEGQEVKPNQMVADPPEDGKTVIFEIENVSPSLVQDITFVSEFPIESADGPDPLEPGQRATYTVIMDSEKIVWMVSDGKPVEFGVKFRMLKVVGGAS